MVQRLAAAFAATIADLYTAFDHHTHVVVSDGSTLPARNPIGPSNLNRVAEDLPTLAKGIRRELHLTVAPTLRAHVHSRPGQTPTFPPISLFAVYHVTGDEEDVLELAKHLKRDLEVLANDFTGHKHPVPPDRITSIAMLPFIETAVSTFVSKLEAAAD